MSAIRSVYLRVDGFEERRIGDVTGGDFDGLTDNIVALLRDAADEMDRLKTA